MVRVLVIDDAPSFRALLRYTLPEEGDIELAGEASSLHEGLELAARLRPDVVLTDIHLERSALDHVGELRSAAGDGARVVLLSGLGGAELAEAAARAGADGHVEKAADPAQVRAAVRGVA